MKYVPRIIGFLSPIAFGLLLAVLAIAIQDGYARGYASIGFFFLIGPLVLALAVVGIVVMSLGKGIQNGLLLIASAFTLPATYIFVLFWMRSYNGE